MRPKQQAKSPAELSAEFNEATRVKLGVTYTTSDGKQFHSEPLIVTIVNGSEKTEKLSEKRRRDYEAKQQALEHETNLRMKRTETPVRVRKMTKEEFAEWKKNYGNGTK
jgi:hypothetical protein